jgi:pSer/pThr/pTyr-binding forkhead associated (FHA) protein
MPLNEETTAYPEHPAPSDTAPPRLIIANGDNIGQEYPLTRFPVRIGREPNAEIRLDTVTVSKKHARIINKMGDIILSDMGSTNGVFVNNFKVREWLLRNGDTIRIGNTIFLFQSIKINKSVGR